MINQIHGEYISNYSVKIEFLGFKKRRYGSGVLLKRKEIIYLITAKHNFKKKDDDEHTDVKIKKLHTQLSNKKITVLNEKNESVCRVDKLLYIEDNLDLAIFSIKDCSEELLSLDRLSILTNDDYRKKEHFYYGFQGGKEGKYKGSLKNIGRKKNDNKTFILEHSKNIINGQYFSGYSGSGVFIENDLTYYLVGIIIKADETSDNFEVIDLRIVYAMIDEKLKKENMPLFYDEIVTNNNYEIIDGIKMVKVDLPNKSLYVSIYPVTYYQYDLFSAEKRDGKKINSYLNIDRKKFPVVKITYDDAIEFVSWLSENSKNNFKYTLLSSEEWELIAYENMTEFNICYNGNIPTQIGTNYGKKGLYDFLGNIQEVCRDKIVRGGFFENNLNKIIKNREGITLLPRKEVGFRVIQVNL